MKHWLYFFIFVFCCAAFPKKASAQNRGSYGGKYNSPSGVLSITGGIGVAYYMGDLRDGVNMKHLGLGPSVSLGALYRITEHMSARGEIRFYQVSADQQYSKNNRNLSFRTRNPDINLGLQLDLFSFNSHAKVNPYLFGGFGVTLINPKTEFEGKWHSLAPLQTEAVKYSRMPLVLTGGLGVSFKTTEQLSLGLELCNSFVQSDYLDDISTFYPNPDALTSDLAKALSDRSQEIGLAPQQPGWIRGNPDKKDSYLFFQVRATYQIGNRMQARERRKTKCPKF